jgi:hypothetical protein
LHHSMGEGKGFSIFNTSALVSCESRKDRVDWGKSKLRYNSDDEAQLYNRGPFSKAVAVTSWTPEKEKIKIIKQGK